MIHSIREDTADVHSTYSEFANNGAQSYMQSSCQN